MFFKIKSTTQLKKLMDAYCQKQSVPLLLIVLAFAQQCEIFVRWWATSRNTNPQRTQHGKWWLNRCPRRTSWRGYILILIALSSIPIFFLSICFLILHLIEMKTFSGFIPKQLCFFGTFQHWSNHFIWKKRQTGTEERIGLSISLFFSCFGRNIRSVEGKIRIK